MARLGMILAAFAGGFLAGLTLSLFVHPSFGTIAKQARALEEENVKLKSEIQQLRDDKREAERHLEQVDRRVDAWLEIYKYDMADLKRTRQRVKKLEQRLKVLEKLRDLLADEFPDLMEDGESFPIIVLQSEESSDEQLIGLMHQNNIILCRADPEAQLRFLWGAERFKQVAYGEIESESAPLLFEYGDSQGELRRLVRCCKEAKGDCEYDLGND